LRAIDTILYRATITDRARAQGTFRALQYLLLASQTNVGEQPIIQSGKIFVLIYKYLAFDDAFIKPTTPVPDRRCRERVDTW
jgi:hypothetical protein